MKRTVGARYLPLAAIVAIQLLIVAVAPSTMNNQSVDTGAGGFDPGTPGDGANDFTDPETGEVVDDGTGEVAIDTGGDAGGGDAGGGDAGGGDAGGGNEGNPTPVAQGDTSHCVGDRQFDPTIDFYAPPCVGKSDGKNPGETYQGVTGDTIKIVQYYGAGDPAVNAILQAQGSFVEPAQHRAYNEKAAKFINENYELYGRKVTIEVVEGTCNTIPPDISCLQGEMRRLVQDKKPFAVKWNTSLCSKCYEELSKLKTVNLGGWNFRDEFGQRWRPYHYDVTVSGTRLAQHAGRMWCNQLKGNKAEYSRGYRDANRLLGVIATNDPQNQQTIEIDLKAEIAKCGESYGNRKYFYAQDISTADQQRRAGVLAMRGAATNLQDDATSVMCFCDLVAPSFLYQEQDNQQYYPENIITGAGFMDTDQASQAYEGSVGCPQPVGDCAFKGAFGFRSTGTQGKTKTGRGHQVWTAAGGGPLGSTPYESADTEWDYLNLIASAAQMAGPNLNPETFEQGAFRLGARGDANNVLRQISPGNYSWGQDVMRVYWSSDKPSPYNGKPGTYVHLDKQRTRIDGWAKQKLTLPANR